MYLTRFHSSCISAAKTILTLFICNAGRVTCPFVRTRHTGNSHALKCVSNWDFFSDIRFHLEERILSKFDCEILVPGLLLWRLCATQVLMIFLKILFNFVFSLQSQMILIYLRSLWEEICRFTFCSFMSSLVTVTIWEAAPHLNWQWQNLCLTRILSEQ